MDQIEKQDGLNVRFKDVTEIQDLLEKTTSTEDRMKTSLLLLSSQINEMKTVIHQLEEFSSIIEKEAKNSEPQP